MANYYDYSVIDVTDVRHVGLGFGDAPDGTERICVGLAGAKINQDLRVLEPGLVDQNWIALTEKCARDLYELLDQYFGPPVMAENSRLKELVAELEQRLATPPLSPTVYEGDDD